MTTDAPVVLRQAAARLREHAAMLDDPVSALAGGMAGLAEALVAAGPVDAATVAAAIQPVLRASAQQAVASYLTERRAKTWVMGVAGGVLLAGTVFVAGYVTGQAEREAALMRQCAATSQVASGGIACSLWLRAP